MMMIRILIPALLCGACAKHPGPVVPQTPVERKMLGLLEKFDRWDDDGDGQLDTSELTTGLAGSDHRPANVIAFYDTDGDQRISLREAQAGYRRAGEAEQRIQARKAAEAGR